MDKWSVCYWIWIICTFTTLKQRTVSHTVCCHRSENLCGARTLLPVTLDGWTGSTRNPDRHLYWPQACQIIVYSFWSWRMSRELKLSISSLAHDRFKPGRMEWMQQSVEFTVGHFLLSSLAGRKELVLARLNEKVQGAREIHFSCYNSPNSRPLADWSGKTEQIHSGQNQFWELVRSI